MNGYAEQARLADCTRKHENLAARLAEARSRATALESPGSLNPGSGPAGATDAYMLRLQAAYAEILAPGLRRAPRGLHTDEPEYDY
jgi:hypothetical protein